MKKLLCSSLGLLVTASILHAQTIAQWTFETSVPATAGPFAAEVGTGSALGFHTGAAVYSNPVGNGSVESFSSTVWSVGDYWQFQTSTLGFQNIGLSFDQVSSSTGPRDFYLAWSTDGSTFTKFGNDYTVLVNTAPNAWSSNPANHITTTTYSFDLSSVTDLNNAPNVYFRLVDDSTVSAGGGTVATGGTDRIDNFLVAVPEPTSLSLMGGFGLLAWTLIRRRK